MNHVVAVVTGGGRGVGAATAMRLASRGLRVVVSARSESELAATEGAIAALHGADRVCRVACDVSDAREVERLAQVATRFAGDAGVHVLVNNAGIAPRAFVHEMDEAMWDAVLDVNLKGTWLCTRAFLPGMLARRAGRIVNVGSISSTLGTARMSAYCAAKWGVVGFTKSVAEETRGLGVQAVAVLPGSIDTRMLEGSGFDAQMTADEVARTIEFLALDAAPAITGSAVEMFG
ncbi:MAG: SDR family NAD(P)-dependent oxidoreductase [Deltaproteobacteria bacterium]